MSSRQNLNDNLSDRFEFSIGGLDYDLLYPTLEQIEPISEINAEREKEEDKEKLKELDKKMSDIFYSLIVPVGHSNKIQDTLKKQPVKVVQAFNEMVKEQLSAE